MTTQEPQSRAPKPWSSADFRPIAATLRLRQGGLLPPQRIALIRARLQGRLQARGIPSFTWFHDQVLRPRPEGRGMQMVMDLSTVNHSAFFREPASLRFVADRLVERLRARPAMPLRAWSAGCSAGQEPYSLAMAMVEQVPDLAPEQFTVWASDVSLEMVEAAARAIYAAREADDVSPERLRRFFLRGRGPRHGSFRVAPEVRRLVTFRHFDLRDLDWPVPGDFDAILCRNVTLYLPEADRVPLIDRLAGSLREGGWLVIGNCEILPGPPRTLTKHAPSIYIKGAPP